MGMTRVCGIALVGALSAPAFGTAFSDMLREPGYRDSFVRSLTEDQVLKGDYAFSMPGRQGLFCQEESQVKLDYAATLESTGLDVDNHGNTVITYVLQDSRLTTQGYAREGLFCQWGGGRGSIAMGKLSVKLVLSPNGEHEVPSIAAEDAQFNGFRIEDVGFGLRDWFMVTGDAPEWLNNWVEGNMRTITNAFFASPLKGIVNRAASKALADWLMNRTQGQPPVVMQMPVELPANL